MFTPFPYLNYYYKYAGLILAAVGLAMILIPSLSSMYDEWLLLIGLFTIAYSKEKKQEQGLIKQYRYNSLRITFAISLIVLLVFTFRNLIAEYSNEINVIFLGIGYVSVYLIIYYIHILSRVKELNIDQDIQENFKNNKLIYYTVYLILVILILFIIFLTFA